MIEFCGECFAMVPVHIEIRDEEYNVRGVRKVTVEAEVAVCNKCGKDVGCEELDDATLRRAYAEAGWDPDAHQWLPGCEP